MRNAELDEAQAGIKIAGRYINNLRYADGTTFMAESQEELESLLMKVPISNTPIMDTTVLSHMQHSHKVYHSSRLPGFPRDLSQVLRKPKT